MQDFPTFKLYRFQTLSFIGSRGQEEGKEERGKEEIQGLVSHPCDLWEGNKSGVCAQGLCPHSGQDEVSTYLLQI